MNKKSKWSPCPKPKKKVESIKIEDIKWSARTILLAMPKHSIAKYDPTYNLSFDVKYNGGRPSPYRQKSIRGQPGRCGERIPELATPKHVTKKYQKPKEIYHSIVPLSVRECEPRPETEKLAEPKKLRLMLFEEEYKNKLPWNQIKKVRERIAKSPDKFTPVMEDRFAPPPKTKNWKKSDWENHESNIKRLATPKPVHRPPRTPRKRKPLSSLLFGINELSNPKSIYTKEIYYDYPPVSKAAMLYELSDRILELSAPKPDLSNQADFYPFKTCPEALVYTATERIISLAQPKPKQDTRDMDIKENPFGVEPSALTYKATARILKLATPKS